jgi:hypothetical protein
MTPFTRRVHGIIDYAVAALLIVAPWLLGFADHRTATAVTVGFGVVALLYSLFTDYELGLVRRLPMRVHLLIDVVWGLGLIASPWVFGFAGRVAWPHIIVGLAGLAVTALTQRPPAPQVGFVKSAEQARLKEA